MCRHTLDGRTRCCRCRPGRPAEPQSVAARIACPQLHSPFPFFPFSIARTPQSNRPYRLHHAQPARCVTPTRRLGPSRLAPAESVANLRCSHRTVLCPRSSIRSQSRSETRQPRWHGTSRCFLLRPIPRTHTCTHARAHKHFSAIRDPAPRTRLRGHAGLHACSAANRPGPERVIYRVRLASGLRLELPSAGYAYRNSARTAILSRRCARSTPPRSVLLSTRAQIERG